MSDVRGELLKANNEVHARRRMLEFSLQRMDSVVPPETSVPKRVTRFREEEPSIFGGVDNVAFRGNEDV